MTKTQIWVAVFLGVFIVLFGISKLTEDTSINSYNESYTEKNNQTGGNNQAGETAQTAETQSPFNLIKNNGCTSCHGPDLRGSNLGPSLMNVKEHWNSREKLIAYFRNPPAYSGSDFIKEYKEKYKSVIMPSYNHVDVKDLGRIADYLMGF